eukprot:RCo017964
MQGKAGLHSSTKTPRDATRKSQEAPKHAPCLNVNHFYLIKKGIARVTTSLNKYERQDPSIATKSTPPSPRKRKVRRKTTRTIYCQFEGAMRNETKATFLFPTFHSRLILFSFLSQVKNTVGRDGILYRAG